MRVIKFIGITLVCVLVLGATAYAAGFATARRDRSAPLPQPGVESSYSPSVTPSAPPVTTSPATPEPPAHVLEPGEKGEKVRELQSRLFQIGWFGELTTGRYDDDTLAAVAGFQAKRGFEATGSVDQRTWARLLKMTEMPTHDAMFNILRPGPRLLGAGDTGDAVRDLQARLKQIDWYFGDVTGTFDAQTIEAVNGFQAKREIPVTGEVDQRTIDRLHGMTLTPTHEELFNIKPQPGALDPRCLTGRALCIDKTSRFLSWVVNGKVQETVEVRFGSSETPTREGLFHVYLKSRDHVSKLYGSAMPFAMFFSGGQAVHYSSDFASRGYDGASHGCVNVRDYDTIAWLFDQVRVGDKVVVYWS